MSGAALAGRIIPPPADVEAEIIRRGGFREFVRRAWKHIDSSTLRWNWHIDAMCEHLEAVSRHEITKLVINIPPGFSKSSVSSIMWPAWVWGPFEEPDHRFLCATHSENLSHTLARKSRALMETEWYRDRWQHVRFPRDKTSSIAVGFYQNSRKGYRHSITVPSSEAHGNHPDTHDIDDPNNTEDAEARSLVEMERTLQWHRHTMATRFRDHTRKAQVCTMQRLHQIDLASELIREGAVVLCLPMRFEAKHPHSYAKGTVTPAFESKTHDPRTDGELLDPVRLPEEQLAATEVTLGPTVTAAQHQMRPSPPGGGIFKEAYFKRRWTELPKGGTFTISVDCKFKDKTTKSWVVIQVWMQLGPDYYLVDQDRGQYGFLATVTALEAMCIRWPEARKKLVEAKANGPAVVEVLKTKLNGLEEVETGSADKEARAHSCEPVVASGNVILPDHEKARYPDGRVGAPWVMTDFWTEVTTFPNSATNDQVDTMTQFLNSVVSSYAARMAAAMKSNQGRGLGL